MKDKLIFLDIDGVLNSSTFINDKVAQGTKDFIFLDTRAINLLLDVIKETNAKVIITSTWRSYDYESTIEEFAQYEELKDLLPHIYGVTPTTMIHTRGQEIQYFMNYIRKRNFPAQFRCPISSDYDYVIIDDDTDFLDNQREHLVHTNFEFGFTEADKQKVINILNNQ